MRQLRDRQHAVTEPQVEELTHDRSGCEQVAVGQLSRLGPAADRAEERQDRDNTVIINTVIVSPVSAGGGGRGRDVSVIGQRARPDGEPALAVQDARLPRTVRRGGPCCRFRPRITAAYVPERTFCAAESKMPTE